jgi:hypothetical protein
MKYFFIIITLFIHLSATSLAAELVFDNNGNCKKIYESISALKLDQAIIDIKKEQAIYPNNAMPILLANYVDFFQLFFNESEVLYKAGLNKRNLRLSVLEQSANKNTAMYKHALAMIHFQWFFIKIKHKDYISAIQDLRRANNYFLDNKAKYPNWKEGDVYIGALAMAVGSLPSSYKWIAGILGISGNVANGNRLIETAIANKSSDFYIDNLLIYCYTKQYFMNHAPSTWQLLKPYQSTAANNRLLTFIIANIALNQNKAAEAEQIILANYNKNEFLKIPILDYELGCAQLHQLNPNCIIYFEKFLRQYKGKVYVKDAFYKMAMMQYIKGDITAAKQSVTKIDKYGSEETDADKNANKFYNNPLWPNLELLKARFLNDGGNNQLALQVLNTAKFQNNELEFTYRKGRVLDDLQMNDSAIIYYDKAIKIGFNSTDYFAAKAALQCGYIYEERKQNATAIKYYNTILKMPKHDSQNSIEQKAKAGLQRLGM